jgi:hypothetical protein
VTIATAANPWRLAVIGAVGALAIGMGIAAGSFLLSSRTALGAGAAYVPASAPFYLELRVEPSAAQDASLRELLARFGPIEGLDPDRPLHAQLVEHLDQLLASEGVDLTWAGDVAPWFDGHLAVAVNDIPLELEPIPGEMMVPPVPPVVVLLGVTDAAAAEAAIGRITAAADAPAFTATEHGGVTVHVAAGDEAAYALTSDQLIVGSGEAAVVAALDAHADAASTLARKDGMTELTGALPSDWLAFATYDVTDLVSRAFDEAAGVDTATVDAFRALMEHQSLRGAMAVSAAGDRILLDAVSDLPTGPFAVENADRGLAAEVPGDVLYYSEAVNLGAALAGVIEPLKAALADTPEMADQVATAEAALGADLEELVSWIDDAAIAAGIDGDAPYAGLVVAPNDMEAAERRLSQLATFASLAGLDPSSGVTVSEEDVDGVAVTTLRWASADPPTEILGMPTDLVVEWAATDDRVFVGFGDTFVRRGLALAESDSLAAEPRYADAVDELGGSANAGVTWVDLAGAADAVGSLMGPMMPMDPGEAALDWLGPLDRFVSVSRVNGDLIVQRAALLVE